MRRLFFFLAGVLLCSCEPSHLVSTVNKAVVFPEVIHSSIGNAEEGVPLKPNVVLSFSRSMDALSVANCLLFERAGLEEWEVEMIWSDDGRTLSISPVMPCLQNNIYALRLGREALSSDGIPLKDGFEIHFRTTDKDVLPPKVIGSNPGPDAVDIPGNQNVVVFFDEEMDKDTIPAAFSIDDRDGNEVQGGISWNGCNLLFKPDQTLEALCEYTIRVSRDATDVCGNALENEYTSHFRVFGRLKYLRTIGASSKYFYKPLAIAVRDDAAGQSVYLTNPKKGAIEKYVRNDIEGQPDTSYLLSFVYLGFAYPLGIACDSYGNYYITQSSEGFVSILKFDKNNAFIASTDLGDNWQGSFIATDASGFVYINRYTGNPSLGQYWYDIEKYDSDLNEVDEFFYDSFYYPMDPYQPAGVAVDSAGNIYAADILDNTVKKLDPTGAVLKEWGGSGVQDGQFYGPEGVAVNSLDHVFVADAGNDRIQEFDADGNFIGKWGQKGAGDGEFDNPYGIAIDQNDDVFVADSGNYRIQEFSADGTWITSWGYRGVGTLLNGPIGLALDKEKNLYVVDSNTYRILVLAPDGTLLREWGSYGDQAGQFKHPYGIAIDEQGYVYVTDMNTFYSSFRIQKFDSMGTWISSWDSKATRQGGYLSDVCGISIDENGLLNVYFDRREQYDTSANLVMESAEGEDYTARHEVGNGLVLVSNSRDTSPRPLFFSVFVLDQNADALLACSTWKDEAGIDSYFLFPAGITSDGDGNIYIADREAHNVLVFELVSR